MSDLIEQLEGLLFEVCATGIHFIIYEFESHALVTSCAETVDSDDPGS